MSALRHLAALGIAVVAFSTAASAAGFDVNEGTRLQDVSSGSTRVACGEVSAELVGILVDETPLPDPELPDDPDPVVPVLVAYLDLIRVDTSGLNAGCVGAMVTAVVETAGGPLGTTSVPADGGIVELRLLTGDAVPTAIIGDVAVQVDRAPIDVEMSR